MNMKKEADIYKSYLPKQMTEEELTKEIGLFLGNNADANMGQVMGFLKQNFGGLYDGRTASALVKGLL